ncbi:sialidase family protein [Niabella terrae]
MVTCLLILGQLGAAAQYIHQSVIWPQGVDSSYGIKEHFVYGLIEASNGNLLAFAEGRIDKGDASPHHIILKRSLDKGETWSPSVPVVKSTAGASYANPTPVIDQKTGKIFLFFARNFHNDSTQLFFITSDDHGINWSRPRDISFLMQGDPLGRPFHLPGPGHGITMENGRMVVQVWHRFPVKLPVHQRKYGVSVIYSDDHGNHWQPGGFIPGVDSFTANESRIILLGGDALLLNARLSELGNHTGRGVSYSYDGGITWSWPVRSRIPPFTAVDAGFNTFRFQGKRFMVCSRPMGPGRNNLGVSYSADSGKHWSNPKIIFEGPANYSDIIVLKDGSFLLLYGRGRPRYTAVARFDLAWLMNEYRH